MEDKTRGLRCEKEQSLRVGARKMKDVYIPPTMGLIIVELESHIAAGSITVKQTEDKVEEGWMVDEIEREIIIDLY